jgi:hypothetical protein
MATVRQIITLLEQQYPQLDGILTFPEITYAAICTDIVETKNGWLLTVMSDDEPRIEITIPMPLMTPAETRESNRRFAVSCALEAIDKRFRPISRKTLIDIDNESIEEIDV